MDKSQVEIWREAYGLFVSIVKLPKEEALEELKRLGGVDEVVRQAVFRLIEASNESTEYLKDMVSHHRECVITAISQYTPGDMFNEFQLLEKIGHGGMSQVYKAKRVNTEQQKKVAIKIFSPTVQSPLLLDQFLNEQKILSKLSHPNIVDFLHGGTTKNQEPYLVMALVDNALPLDQFCRQSAFNVKEKIRQIIICANALAYLHANLIIHRDLKPDNILVNEAGEIKIVDFGIAKFINKDHNLNHTTIMALTPKYAAPEQVNAETVSIKTDVFSLAVIALDLLIDTNPLPADRLIKSCKNDEVYIENLLKSLNTDKDLKNILAKALKTTPDERYETMNSFASDLSAWMEHKPVSATGNTWFYKFTKFAMRRTALFTTVVISLTTLFIMLFALIWQTQATVKEQQRAVEIKTFMLDLFSSADPEKNSEGKLRAVDLLNIASKQLKNRYKQNPEIKAEILTSIGSAFINLGSTYDGEQLLLESLDYDAGNVNTQLKLLEHYIASTIMV